MGHFYAAVVLSKNFAKQEKKIIYNINRLARLTAHTYYGTSKEFTRFVKPGKQRNGLKKWGKNIQGFLWHSSTLPF